MTITPISGGKFAREIAEQIRISQLGGIGSNSLANKVNPIASKARQELMENLTEMKF